MLIFIGGSISAQQENELTRILFILDASNSMNARWGKKTRIQTAKELLSKTIGELEGVPNLEVALRVYGHQSPITQTFQDCNDTKLEVPFGKGNISRIKARIKSIYAKGTTPIARSLEAAAGDFPDNKSRNIIILITDGLEACDNDPCVIAKKLHDKKVKVTPFVIGLGMDLSYLEKFKCIGSYSDAETSEAFERVLQDVVSKALLNTTVQINLNNIHHQPKETDVTMFLYKSGTSELMYTFTHTINKYGNPDTLIIDPKYEYDLVVNTTPKVEKKGIKIKKHTHNIIEVDCPQGYIEVRFINATKPYQVKVRIVENDKKATLNVQNVGEKDKYIVGWYNLEILTLPRIYVTTKVEQSSISHVDIKAPGFLSYTSGKPIVGQIFAKDASGKWDWVCNLESGSMRGEWTLQPGEYLLVYRHKNAKSSSYTNEKTFRINSNLTTSIKL